MEGRSLCSSSNTDYCVGIFLYQRSLEPRYAEVRNTAGKLNALLENDLSGMSTIQSFTAEDRELRRVKASVMNTGRLIVKQSGYLLHLSQ